MALFENFPYTNFHDMNLDYLLKRVRELEGEVADLAALIETGPVVDVKTLVNGVSTSIKDSSGIANLPAASDTTDGVIGLDAVSDDVLRISGAETFDVPILTGGMIDESQIPPIVEPATSAAFGTVKVASTSAGVNVTSGDGTFTAAKLDSNGDVDASVIPDSGVTAGTYGTNVAAAENTHYFIYDMQVGADGRIIRVYQNPTQIVRSDIVTIPAGSYSAYVMFDSTNHPWYNTDDWITVTPYEYYTNAKGVLNMKPLIYGTDYEYVLTSNMVTINLLTAKTNPVYVVVAGSYGRASM